MTKDEAKQSLSILSYGTLGTLTDFINYNELDIMLETKLNAIDNIDVSGCKIWQDVWAKLE